MNKIERGKKGLDIFSIIVTLMSFMLLAGGILLLVFGIKKLDTSVAGGIIMIVFGVLLTILFLIGIVYGVVMFFTGKAIKATDGSIKVGDLSQGTVNKNGKIKCHNCGTMNNEDKKFCVNCHKKL